MGNSQNKQDSGQKPNHNSKGSNKLSSRISREDFHLFINAAQKLPFPLTEDEFADLVKNLETVNITADSPIIKEGQDGKGIFVVAEGACEVIGSNGITVIRTIENGDFFGEVSTFFGGVCTATVKATVDSGCRLLWLRKDALASYTFDTTDTGRFSKLDWFVSRRYLDVNDCLKGTDLTKKVALDCLRHSPVFYDWSEDSLRHIVQRCPCTLNLYPAGFVLYSTGELDFSAYLMTHGRIELRRGDSKEPLITLSSGPLGLWFGDEGLFCGTPRRTEVVTLTPCVIMTIAKINLESVLSTFPAEVSKLMALSNRWKCAFKERDPSIYSTCHGELDIELLRLALRRTKLFHQAPGGLLYMLSLGVIVKHYHENDVVLIGNECLSRILVILNGSIYLQSGDSLTTKQYCPGDVYFIDDNSRWEHSLKVVSKSESLIGILTKAYIQDVVNIYPDAVLDWTEV